MMALQIRRLITDYDGVRVLNDLSFEIEAGDYVCLLGRSGSGKSTLLAAIAGFVRPSHGQIVIDGHVAFDSDAGINQPPHKRGLGMVFQEDNLWPHLSVNENILFPLRSRGRPASNHLAEELLEHVGLAGYGNRKPVSLSGGQRQRVAICRALAAKPRLVLLDEPLSAVDGLTRSELRNYLRGLFAETGTTALHVTHDPAEAFALGHHVAVLDGGKLAQWSTPADMYRKPETEVVAGLTGSYSGVTVEVELQHQGIAQFGFDGRSWEVPAHPALRPGPARLLLRPEDVRVGSEPGKWFVRKRRFESGLFHVEVEHPNGERIHGVSLQEPRQQTVAIDLIPERCWVLPSKNMAI